jgi:hypothetical protein
MNKTLIITKGTSPSKFEKFVEEELVEITLNLGSKYEKYIGNVYLDIPRTSFKTNDGKTHTINRDFVVKETPFIQLTATVDITEWVNFYEYLYEKAIKVDRYELKEKGGYIIDEDAISGGDKPFESKRFVMKNGKWFEININKKII